MSFADFADIYRICCSNDKDLYTEYNEKSGNPMISSDSVTDPFTRSSRWWELAEKEILHEKKERVLV